MDRYAVIVVDQMTGFPRRYGIYEGEAGADKAHGQAEEWNAKRGIQAFVVGLNAV